MNNTETISSYYERIFGCAWISNHKNEEEFLFCGGQQRMKIEGITIIETNANYKKYLRPLHYFDCILNGGEIRKSAKVDVNKDDLKVIMTLIDPKLNPNKDKARYPDYIDNSFNAYIENKYQISVNIANIKSNFEPFMKLLMTPMKEQNINLLELGLIVLFRNLRHFSITIDHQQDKIDIAWLLELLKDLACFHRNNLALEIKAKHSLASERSWIFVQYQELINTNIAKHFNLKLLVKNFKSKDKIQSYDELTIQPITDGWNCPICFYGHSKSTTKCIMCGYSTDPNASANDHLEQLYLYQQIWSNNTQDQLNQWEINNQYEIERSIKVDHDEKHPDIDDDERKTPREPVIKRRYSKMAKYMSNIDNDEKESDIIDFKILNDSGVLKPRVSFSKMDDYKYGMWEVIDQVSGEIEEPANENNENKEKDPSIEDFAAAAFTIASKSDDNLASTFSNLRKIAERLMDDDINSRALDTAEQEHLTSRHGVSEFLKLLGFESSGPGGNLLCPAKPSIPLFSMQLAHWIRMMLIKQMSMRRHIWEG